MVERLLANLVALLDVDDDASEPAKESVYAVQESAPTGLPPWASPSVENHRGLVTTTSEQYVLLVEMEATGGRGPAVTEAISNTGATRSLIDLDLAQRLGLPVQLAQGSEYRTYFGTWFRRAPIRWAHCGASDLAFWAGSSNQT